MTFVTGFGFAIREIELGSIEQAIISFAITSVMRLIVISNQ